MVTSTDERAASIGAMGFPKARRERKASVIVFGFIWLVFCTLAFGFLVRGYVQQRRAAIEFRPVTATVLSSRVRTSSSPKNGTVYSVDAQYRYNVGGVNYSSRRYSFLGGGRRRDVYDEVARLRVGTQFTAYYDPRDPSRAVINRTRPSMFVPVFFAVVFESMGVVVLAFAIRGRIIPATEPS